MIGALTGACVTAAEAVIEDRLLGGLVTHPGGVRPGAVPPLALLVTWLVSRFVPRTVTPATSELSIDTYRTAGARLPLAQLPGRPLAAVTTGGSQGFEPPRRSSARRAAGCSPAGRRR